MSIDESAYESIDRFLRGEMRGEELSSFLQLLNNNAALKQETETLRDIVDALNHQGRKTLKKQFALMAAAIPAHQIADYKPSLNTHVRPKGNSSWLKKWWWIIVAPLVIAAAVYAYIHYSKPAQPDSESMPALDVAPSENPVPGPMIDSVKKTDSAAIRDVQVKQRLPVAHGYEPNGAGGKKKELINSAAGQRSYEGPFLSNSDTSAK